MAQQPLERSEPAEARQDAEADAEGTVMRIPRPKRTKMIECPRCGGTGRRLTDQPRSKVEKCVVCDGTGRVKVTGR